jgi:negative regulator of flagellin synthesis FlgM
MKIKETLGLNSQNVEGRERAASSGRTEDKAATASGAAAAQAAGDRVELSGRSREMAKAAETLSSTPDVRQKMVADIRRRIDNNEYRVDADKVAGKMIMDFLREIV